MGLSIIYGLIQWRHHQWAHPTYMIYVILMSPLFNHGLFYTMGSHSLVHSNQLKAIINYSIYNGSNVLIGVKEKSGTKKSKAACLREEEEAEEMCSGESVAAVNNNMLTMVAD